MIDKNSIEANIKEIVKYVNNKDITICAAAKTVSPEGIEHAFSCGIFDFGENRVQELLEKYDTYKRLGARLHFIGTLQSNKVKYIIDKVVLIQSVNKISLAQEIDRQAKKHGIVMDVLIEINADSEQTKTGVCVDDINMLVKEIKNLSNVKLRGLMAIPKDGGSLEEKNKRFEAINKIFVDIRAKNKDNDSIDILSMGMSGDYPAAVDCGATMIRPGSKIFGSR